MSRFKCIFLITILLALQACSSTIPLEARHQASGLNTQFNGEQLSFADYVLSSRAMIAKTHKAANATELNKMVDGNSPFEMVPAASCPSGHGKPYRRGILLSHGLSDSPYFMRKLGEFFQENCFKVMAVLLPGNGTQPGDLLDVSWRAWVKAEAYGTDKLAAEVDEVYLAGYSTGGTLSVYQSQRDERVRGLFLFAPALKVSSFAALASLHKIISWAIPSAKWLSIKLDRDWYKYESFPANAATQIYELTKEIDLQSLAVKIPVFAAASEDDTTVDTPTTIKFMANTLNPASKLVLYSRDLNHRPEGMPAEKLEMVNSVFPDQKILSSAHTAIVLPPSDLHYGIAGEYLNCNHYFPDEMDKYRTCHNHSEEDFQGELTKDNLNAGIMRRLTYNPNFAALKVSMKKFIDKLP